MEGGKPRKSDDCRDPRHAQFADLSPEDLKNLKMLKSGELILVPRPDLQTAGSEEPSLPFCQDDNRPGSSPMPQAAPQVDLNAVFSQAPESVPTSEKERLNSNNACAPPSSRISS